MFEKVWDTVITIICSLMAMCGVVGIIAWHICVLGV